MINPSEIDIASLPALPLCERSNLPTSPAIYFAIDSLGKIQYIGQSSNPRRRWSQHHKHGDLEVICGVKIAYLEVSDASLLRSIESALIQWFDPPLNGWTTQPNPGYTKVVRTIEIDVPNLGERIKGARKSDSRSVTQIAGAAGMSVQNWYRIENERQTLPENVLRLIESVLGVDFGVKFND